MREDPLDRLLSSDESLAPSTGFPARVMDAVQQAAGEPPPLALPWARLALGFFAILISAASGVWLVQRLDVSPVVGRLAGLSSELGYAAATIVGTLALLCAPSARMAMRRISLRASRTR
jgi:hypothetical protein